MEKTDEAGGKRGSEGIGHHRMSRRPEGSLERRQRTRTGVDGCEVRSDGRRGTEKVWGAGEEAESVENARGTARTSPGSLSISGLSVLPAPPPRRQPRRLGCCYSSSAPAFVPSLPIHSPPLRFPLSSFCPFSVPKSPSGQRSRPKQSLLQSQGKGWILVHYPQVLQGLRSI